MSGRKYFVFIFILFLNLLRLVQVSGIESCFASTLDPNACPNDSQGELLDVCSPNCDENGACTGYMGDEISFTISFKLGESAEYALMDVQAAHTLFPGYPFPIVRDQNACQVGNPPAFCPIGGSVVQTYTRRIKLAAPGLYPPGDYNVHIQVTLYDKWDVEIDKLCLVFKRFQMLNPPGPQQNSHNMSRGLI